MSPKTRWFVMLCPLLVGFDFASKEAVRDLPLYERIDVLPGWFALTHAENPHVAFSIEVPYALIVAFAIVGLGAMIWQLRQLAPDARLQAAGLAAMASGALGNLVDRVTDGTVTDLFLLYTQHASLAPWLKSTFGTASWPIFNVADVALLVGVTLFLWGTAVDPEAEPLLIERSDQPPRSDAV
jgi:signal peptidase II